MMARSWPAAHQADDENGRRRPFRRSRFRRRLTSRRVDDANSRNDGFHARAAGAAANAMPSLSHAVV